MQKIKRIFSYILIFFLSFGIFSPIGFSFMWKDIYDYSEYFDKINTTFSANMIRGVEHFSTPRTTFIVQFDRYRPQDAEDIEVIWNIDWHETRQFLDIEENTNQSMISTFPFVTDPRSDIAYTIIIHSWVEPLSVSLVSSYHGSVWKKLVFHPFSEVTHAASGPHIISRSEWWADESLRYIPVWKREQDISEWWARGKTPYIIYETQAERDQRIQTESEYNAIAALDPLSSQTYSLKRYEWTQKLVWPIKKVKKIDRIIIHHTAESLDKVADDETLLRAIYYYHTKTKWWGDIGYNYVIWQRGTIYEWRAWGDYVDGAHVYGNNAGTVWISVMGNYENLHLNKDQKIWLLAAIEYVARKYGINVDETDYGASLCGKASSCTWHPVTTLRLIGHKDLAATSCPGRNIYSILPELRNTIVWKVWKLSPIYNTGDKTIDTVDPENVVEYRLKTEIFMPTLIINTDKRIMSSGGKPIKIKLSYPHESLDFLSAGMRAARLILDGKNIPYKKWDTVKIEKWDKDMLKISTQSGTYTGKIVSFSTDLFRISSWSRVPTWDNTGKYNDNIFRAKLIVRNEWWKLLVVNELPIEDYLKWLGEVSNADAAEKIKTIIVAARSYAYFYQNPKNRKYQSILYDGSDDPDSFQKYLGYGYESRSPEVTKYVKMTKWKVISYKWGLIKSWYFSSSDGRTLSYKAYCEARWIQNCEDIPYLQAVDDPAWVGKTRSGHGVGISGIWASYAASLGKRYDEIIRYYMTGVTIDDINKLK